MTSASFRQEPIYKICPAELWRAADRAGRFEGAPVDLADGFIHFSTRAQLAETAARHFAGEADLVLVAVDPGMLGEALRYEPSRGGDLFPHLYGPLSPGAVRSVAPLKLGPDGRHVFPDSVARAATPPRDLTSEGWTRLRGDGLVAVVGPIWRREEEGGIVYGLLAEPRHLNHQGIVHGGMLMTLADQALGVASWKAAGVARQATIQLDTHFVAPVRAGDFVEARCRVVRQTRSVMFMAATLSVADRVVATASGLWKLSSSRRPPTRPA